MPHRIKHLLSIANLKILASWLLLAASIYGCNFSTAATQLPTVPEEIMWTENQSPLLPTTWPPTAGTVWVRYTFAYGSNPTTLMDGVYVSNPLSRTEWKAGAESTIVLNKDFTQAATQGMVPLDEETQKILQNEKQNSEYALNLMGLPDPASPDTLEFLAYYRAWFKYNGAFLDLVRTEHRTFIEWVMQEG